MTETVLDRAYAEMDQDDDRSRLRFLGRLSSAEVFLLLKDAPQGETIEAEVFPIEPDPLALIFDTEARLAAFAGGPAPYAAMSGRAVAELLRGRSVGLGVNLGTGTSDFVLPPDGLVWLAETTSATATEAAERFVEVRPPRGVPDIVVAEIDARLAGFEGQALRAYLALAETDAGRSSHVLAVVGAPDVAQGAISQAVNSALVFSGVEAAEMDVLFLDEGDALVQRLEPVALRIDLPEPTEAPVTSAPGSNPDSPPRLR